MLRNQRPLFHNDHQDDALTVQASDANSHLGQLLLEADWADALAHLATPEGQRDVDAGNDPLGLFDNQLHHKNERHVSIPSRKNTVFFASLFVRAPYDVIDRIFTIAPSHVDVDPPDDLMYVLSVVPSQEEAHSQELSRKVPYRTRAWSSEEYSQILNLLIQSFVSSKSPSSSLLKCLPPWAIGCSDYPLTPLGIAAYNPDVPANIVQTICTLESKAMEGECTLAGRSTIPLILAAASPLPEDSSSKYNDAKNMRWEKVKLLTLADAWYDEQRKVVLEDYESNNDIKRPLTFSSPPEPTMYEVQLACDKASRRNEWELVREFLNQYYTMENEARVDKSAPSMLEPKLFELIRAALEQHDAEVRSNTERHRQAREKARSREEWFHKNMGLVKYPIDTLLDLVSVVIPSSRKRHDDEADRGIVGPMS